MSNNYQQQNIYVQNFIRSRNYDFSPAYSELIGRLCAVESAMTMRESGTGFCDELMAVLKGFGSYDRIDRICLTLRCGPGNDLAVIDSCNSARGGENTMVSGYRCFVRPNSSLLSLREGEIRVYDNASRVADAFAQRAKPIQRSLARVMKMGFKSGACLPLHFSGKLRGFLFLNSCEEALFTSLSDEDYAVLNIIAMISKLALLSDSQEHFDASELCAEDFVQFTSRLFDEDELAAQIHGVTRWLTGESWRPTLKIEGDDAFLYVPTSVAFAIAKICELFYSSPSNYPSEVRVKSLEGETVRVEVPLTEAAKTPTFERFKSRVQMLESQVAFLRLKLVSGISSVSIEFPFDPVFKEREDIRYSV